MSTNCDSVSILKNSYYGSDSKTESSDDKLSRALASGNFPVESLKTETQETNKKSKKEKFIEDTAKLYNIKSEIIIKFIKSATGVNSIEELNDEQFNIILDRIFSTVLDKAENQDGSYNEYEISNYARKFNFLLKKNFSFDEASEFFCDTHDMSLQQVIIVNLDSDTQKKYMKSNISEIPQEIIDKSIQKLIDQYHVSNQENGIGKIKAFKELLENTSDKDFNKILDSFIRICSQKDEKFANLLRLIKNFEEHPEEIDKFIDNQVCSIVSDELSQEEIREKVRDIKDIFIHCKRNEDGSLNVKELLEALLNEFSPEQRLAKLKTKKENNEELSETQQKALDELLKYKELTDKKRNGKKLSIEEDTYLQNFNKKRHDIQTKVCAALTENKPKEDVETVIAEAEKYGVSREDLFHEIAQYKKQFAEFNIDLKMLDELSNGEFSQILREEGVQLLDTSENTNTNEDSSLDFGFAKTGSEETYWAVSNNLDNTIQNLYNDSQQDSEYVVIKDSTKKNNSLTTPLNKYSFIERLSGTELLEGLAKKYIKITEAINKYKELSQSGKDLINKLVEIMSPDQQSYFFYGIKNSIVLAIIRHTNIDPSKLNLNLDHASTQAIKNMIKEQEELKG